MNFGKALRLIRASRNVSQKQLSEAAGLDPSYISFIEKGKRAPTLQTSEKIVNALDIPLHLFFLLASGEDQIKKISSRRRVKIAELLLDLLLSAEKMA